MSWKNGQNVKKTLTYKAIVHIIVLVEKKGKRFISTWFAKYANRSNANDKLKYYYFGFWSGYRFYIHFSYYIGGVFYRKQ